MPGVLFPYGRRPRTRDAWLIDRWLGPGWRLLEAHEATTTAPPALVLQALEGLAVDDLPVVRRLFALRGLHVRRGATVLSFFQAPPFVLLEREPGVEFAGGVLLPGQAPAPRTARDFERVLATASLAAIASFRAEALPGGGARLATRTWVRSRGAVPAAAFGAYWLAVGPFSAWIRRIFLREALKRVA